MKKLLALIIVFALGGVVGWKLPLALHAQQPSTTLTCNLVGPCSQWIVQVNSGRGMGRFQVYPVTDTALPTSGTAPYSGNAVSLQFDEPAPRGTQTFTLSVVEP